MSAGDGSAHYDEDLSGPNHRTGDAVRNPAQVSFFLLEPAADAATPWLQVVPAVSDELARDVMYGTVPELAAKATWADRDIYISRPDAMIIKTAQVLMDRGAPRHLIRYDLGDES